MKDTHTSYQFKNDKEKKILFSLVDYYIQTGKPVGSNTLKEMELNHLSSATIRNYFAHLEQGGYLKQQHTSGGRIPTERAFKCYAFDGIPKSDAALTFKEYAAELEALRNMETREIATYLQQAAETLSKLTETAIFLSAPRFDHDFIIDLKVTVVDARRCLCILITDFGAIQTEVIYTDKKISAFMAKKLESYFQWRLTGKNKPEHLEQEDLALAQKLYQELMLRYIISYSNFTQDEIYRTGFSKLLSHADFQETSSFATTLTLFENAHSMSLLLKETTKLNTLKFWIGEDLIPYCSTLPNCTVIAIPYKVNQIPVGAIGLLGPIRTPYRTWFQLMHAFADSISQSLTRNVYKYKLSFRQPEEKPSYFLKEENRLIGQSRLILIEDKTKNSG